MTFAYPWVLLLLAAPLLLIVWGWQRGGQRVVLPLDYGTAKPGAWLRRLINLAGALPAFLLATAIVLLAGPQQISEPKSKRVLTNISSC